MATKRKRPEADQERKPKRSPRTEDTAAEPSQHAPVGQLSKDTPLTETQTLGGLEISIPGMIVLNSKPGGGKSHMLRYIMYMYRKRFDHGIAFSKSTFRPGNLDYMPAFPDEPDKWLNFKHLHWSEEVLQAFLDGQAADPSKLGFVLVDDNISDPNMWYSKAFIDAATMYRQYNILLVISTQHTNRISTTIRECASQVGLFAMDTHNAIHACWESYGQEFRNDRDFYAWFSSILGDIKNHNCAWKNKIDGKPYVIVRAPKEIPAFRIEYGKKARPKKKRRTKEPKGVNWTIGRNLGHIQSAIKRLNPQEGQRDM